MEARQLRFGDAISLTAEEHGGLIHGNPSARCHCYVDMRKDFEANCSVHKMHQTAFVLTPQLQYSALRLCEKKTKAYSVGHVTRKNWKKHLDPESPVERDSELIKYFETADEEDALNVSEEEQMKGQAVTYGSIIQLKHDMSKLFLTQFKDRALQNGLAVEVGLCDGNEASGWRLRNADNQKSFGDPVLYGDTVYLENGKYSDCILNVCAESPLEVANLATSQVALHYTVQERLEVDSATDGSALKLNPYRPYDQAQESEADKDLDDLTSLWGLDVVVFHRKTDDCVLSANADTRKVIWMTRGAMRQEQDIPWGLSALWRVLPKDINWAGAKLSLPTEMVLLEHVQTGLYLTIDKGDLAILSPNLSSDKCLFRFDAKFGSGKGQKPVTQGDSVWILGANDSQEVRQWLTRQARQSTKSAKKSKFSNARLAMGTNANPDQADLVSIQVVSSSVSQVYEVVSSTTYILAKFLAKLRKILQDQDVEQGSGENAEHSTFDSLQKSVLNCLNESEAEVVRAVDLNLQCCDGNDVSQCQHQLRESGTLHICIQILKILYDDELIPLVKVSDSFPTAVTLSKRIYRLIEKGCAGNQLNKSALLYSTPMMSKHLVGEIGSYQALLQIYSNSKEQLENLDDFIFKGQIESLKDNREAKTAESITLIIETTHCNGEPIPRNQDRWVQLILLDTPDLVFQTEVKEHDVLLQGTGQEIDLSVSLKFLMTSGESNVLEGDSLASRLFAYHLKMLELFEHLVAGRNEKALKALKDNATRFGVEYGQLCKIIQTQGLPFSLKSQCCRLMAFLYIDVEPHRRVSNQAGLWLFGRNEDRSLDEGHHQEHPPQTSQLSPSTNDSNHSPLHPDAPTDLFVGLKRILISVLRQANVINLGSTYARSFSSSVVFVVSKLVEFGFYSSGTIWSPRPNFEELRDIAQALLRYLKEQSRRSRKEDKNNSLVALSTEIQISSLFETLLKISENHRVNCLMEYWESKLRTCLGVRDWGTAEHALGLQSQTQQNGDHSFHGFMRRPSENGSNGTANKFNLSARFTPVQQPSNPDMSTFTILENLPSEQKEIDSASQQLTSQFVHQGPLSTSFVRSASIGSKIWSANMRSDSSREEETLSLRHYCEDNQLWTNRSLWTQSEIDGLLQRIFNEDLILADFAVAELDDDALLGIPEIIQPLFEMLSSNSRNAKETAFSLLSSLFKQRTSVMDSLNSIQILFRPSEALLCSQLRRQTLDLRRMARRLDKYSASVREESAFMNHCIDIVAGWNKIWRAGISMEEFLGIQQTFLHLGVDNVVISILSKDIATKGGKGLLHARDSHKKVLFSALHEFVFCLCHNNDSQQRKFLSHAGLFWGRMRIDGLKAERALMSIVRNNPALINELGREWVSKIFSLIELHDSVVVEWLDLLDLLLQCNGVGNHPAQALLARLLQDDFSVEVLRFPALSSLDFFMSMDPSTSSVNTSPFSKSDISPAIHGLPFSPQLHKHRTTPKISDIGGTDTAAIENLPRPQPDTKETRRTIKHYIGSINVVAALSTGTNPTTQIVAANLISAQSVVDLLVQLQSYDIQLLDTEDAILYIKLKSALMSTLRNVYISTSLSRIEQELVKANGFWQSKNVPHASVMRGVLKDLQMAKSVMEASSADGAAFRFQVLEYTWTQLIPMLTAYFTNNVASELERDADYVSILSQLLYLLRELCNFRLSEYLQGYRGILLWNLDSSRELIHLMSRIMEAASDVAEMPQFVLPNQDVLAPVPQPSDQVASKVLKASFLAFVESITFHIDSSEPNNRLAQLLKGRAEHDGRLQDTLLAARDVVSIAKYPDVKENTLVDILTTMKCCLYLEQQPNDSISPIFGESIRHPGSSRGQTLRPLRHRGLELQAIHQKYVSLGCLKAGLHLAAHPSLCVRTHAIGLLLVLLHGASDSIHEQTRSYLVGTRRTHFFASIVEIFDSTIAALKGMKMSSKGISAASEATLRVHSRRDSPIVLTLRLVALLCGSQNQDMQDMMVQQANSTQSFDVLRKCTNLFEIMQPLLNNPRNKDLFVLAISTVRALTSMIKGPNEKNQRLILSSKFMHSVNMLFGTMVLCSDDNLMKSDAYLKSGSDSSSTQDIAINDLQCWLKCEILQFCIANFERVSDLQIPAQILSRLTLRNIVHHLQENSELLGMSKVAVSVRKSESSLQAGSKPLWQSIRGRGRDLKNGQRAENIQASRIARQKKFFSAGFREYLTEECGLIFILLHHLQDFDDGQVRQTMADIAVLMPKLFRHFQRRTSHVELMIKLPSGKTWVERQYFVVDNALYELSKSSEIRAKMSKLVLSTSTESSAEKFQDLLSKIKLLLNEVAWLDSVSRHRTLRLLNQYRPVLSTGALLVSIMIFVSLMIFYGIPVDPNTDEILADGSWFGRPREKPPAGYSNEPYPFANFTSDPNVVGSAYGTVMNSMDLSLEYRLSLQSRWDHEAEWRYFPEGKLIIRILGIVHAILLALCCSAFLVFDFPLIYLESLKALKEEQKSKEGDTGYILSKLLWMRGLSNDSFSLGRSFKPNRLGSAEALEDEAHIGWISHAKILLRSVWIAKLGWHYAMLMAISLLALRSSPLLYAFCMLDYYRMPGGQMVMRSLYVGGPGLVRSMLVGVLTIAVIGSYSYAYFSQSAIIEDETCHSPYQCVAKHFLDSIRGDITTVLGNFGAWAFPGLVFWADSWYSWRTCCIVAFVIFWTFLLQPVMQGQIIDAFAKIRSDIEAAEKDKEDKCFISGIERPSFNSYPGEWEQRRAGKYVWNYFYYFHWLKQANFEELNGLHRAALAQFENGKVDFFPIGAFVGIQRAKLEVADQEEDVKSFLVQLRDDMSRKFEAQKFKMDGLKDWMAAIEQSTKDLKASLSRES